MFDIEQINISTVDTIMAMKMDAIINYRTKSRDFYDIYTISKNHNISLFEMLDRYNQEYNQKTKESELLYRFLDKKLDSNDEGLSSMNLKEQIGFGKLRRWIANEIKNNRQKEIEIINDILENPLLIKEHSDRYFGFERVSLLQKFASIYEPDMVLKSLEISDFDIGYRSISGKNILDYYLDDKKMFGVILFYAKDIPNEWMESRMYNLKGMREMILLENSLINCIKNKSSSKRVEKVAMARGVDLNLFNEMMENKRKIMIRNSNLKKII